MKILSPAGNMECLKMAVTFGADEVYLGINQFNARNNIDGFTLENLTDAVNYAHVYGVKVLLAINILFSNDELLSAFNTVIEAYNMGVDAFIVQDLGLAKLIYNYYPEIELHASTQMGIHNLEGVKFIEKFGFKRVVLARETPLSEVKRIRKNSKIEIEYFVQGALCVSFSGNCYLSSYLCNASGNRGKCKQLCRLPYEFLHGDKILKKGYLLSAKDFNLSKRINQLKEAGVDVIKIEGRARRPFYVAAATQEYRNALNNCVVSQENLKLAFNRGFTEGYFNGNANIISDTQSHSGLEVGTVFKIKFGKKFNEVYFTSNRAISKKTTLKFFNGSTERCTVSAFDLQFLGDDKYLTTTTVAVHVGDRVNVIVDSGLEKQIFSRIHKIGVNISINAIVNQKIRVAAQCKGVSIEIDGEICLPAQNQPLSLQDFVDNFSKSEYFYPIFYSVVIDKVFLPKSILNSLRREVYEKLYLATTNSCRKNLSKLDFIQQNDKFVNFEDFQFVESIEDEFLGKNIIFSPEQYDVNSVECFVEKCKKFCLKPFLDTPNFALKEDICLIKEIIKKTNIGIVANNYYALFFDTEIIGGAGLNVYNNFCATTLDLPVISAESMEFNKINFPYMTLRHCPLKSHLKSDCNKCFYDNNYAYKMENGKILKLKRKKLTTCTFYLTD